MKILVAVDSSPYADGVLDEVAKRAWTKGTEIRIITAVETTGHWDTDDQYSNQCQIILNVRCKRLAEKLPKHLKITGEVVEGSAAQAIVKAARESETDLIMLGSHGDTGIRKLGIGSVAAAVVNEAPCSVEVVKLQRMSRPKSKLVTLGQRER